MTTVKAVDFRVDKRSLGAAKLLSSTPKLGAAKAWGLAPRPKHGLAKRAAA